MSKIGVGVGEDFPVDDGKGENRDSRPGEDRREGFQGAYRPGDDERRRDYDAEYAARREAHRKWREARREWKQQWKDEWRARRRDFKDQFRGSYYDGYRRPHWGFGRPFFWAPRMLWGILAVVAVIAVISFLFTHIYFILGALVLLALFASAFHRGYDPFDLPSHRYERPEQHTPPPPPKPPAQTPRDPAH